MTKRILPIYQTGWFYLLLFFWAAFYTFISTGSLNAANQLNISLLNSLSPNQTLANSSKRLTSNEMLTLHSSFKEYDVEAIATVLENFPNSKIVILGEQSKAFMARLESYLSSAQRKSKIIIATNKVASGIEPNIQTNIALADLVNWFRYSPRHEIKQRNSEYFIFSPFLLNQRQSFPLTWQQKDKTYFSLLAEVLRQLSTNEALSLNEQWQLSLTNPQNTLYAQELAIGFFGEVFTAGEPYTVRALGGKNQQTYVEYLTNSINSASLTKRNAITPLLTVKRFIEQENLTFDHKRNLAMYKLIIIKDDTHAEHNMVSSLIEKLTSQNYLSQNIFTILTSWLLAAAALALIWLIRNNPIKQQAKFQSSLFLGLFIIQYVLFQQQQWLEILPIILLAAGSWIMVYAYQKEHNLFINVLNAAQENLIAAAGPTTASHTRKPQLNDKKEAKQLTKQQLSSIKEAPVIVDNVPNTETTIQVASTAASDNLDQTLVIVDNPLHQAVSHKSTTVENFGRYQVEGVLGKGAMGIVYQGVDPKINRHVAIKTLQLSDNIDSPELTEAKERFFREAQTAGGLSHANIVTIYDVGEENNLGYIAMDLLTGAPLSLFTQPGQTLPVPLVYQLLIQITDALDYAHKQNIVHRDIKPANIIYDDDLLKVTVTDFGIAYVSDHSKTRTGIIMGSPYYMSPEQILGLKVDGRSDIFSLGVTFYQLLCGHLPFEGESIATVAYQITKAKAEAVNQRNTKLPASALRITNKAMHKDIDKRYQTMAEFKLALVNALKRDFKISTN